ncbi:MAG: orotidine-5'-phosphate decarboxylase [Elusimicrobia bacterium CG06_land_8_20_14_3_00_38_11]|nr:MAG: orotidine-5'-phosphate decarboxylase [Elusimicrobia bacterium CG06_land_8_20_14_3_00_38_11]
MNNLKKVIVALDVEDLKKAEELVRVLKDKIDIFKIGSKLFTAYGIEAIKIVTKYGKKVFLDLKYCDIPSVIADAVSIAQKHNVYSLSLHSLGGYEMLCSAAAINLRPKLWAVTILTSLDNRNLNQLGIRENVNREVVRLAKLAKKADVDGIICSPNEIELVKKFGLKVITPGIRISREKKDQKRVLTPQEAFSKGADYIVIGREITTAKQPLKIIEKIV